MAQNIRQEVSIKRKILATALLIIAIVMISFIAYKFCRPMLIMVKDPEAFRTYIWNRSPWSIIAFMAAIFLQVVVAIIPGGPFEIAAGYVFGVYAGAVIADLAMTMGSLFVFLMVRKFGMRFAELFVSREKIESVRFLKHSEKRDLIAFLFFLIPGTPKDLFTYVVGFTDMKLPVWIAITFVGRFPAIFLSAVGGNAVGNRNYMLFFTAIAITVVLFIFGTVFYSRWKSKHPGTKEDKNV